MDQAINILMRQRNEVVVFLEKSIIEKKGVIVEVYNSQ